MMAENNWKYLTLHRKGRVLTPAMKKFIDILTSKDLLGD